MCAIFGKINGRLPKSRIRKVFGCLRFLIRCAGGPTTSMRSVRMGLICTVSRCGGLCRSAKSTRLSVTHSSSELAPPSRICNVVRGHALWKRSAKGGIRSRPAAGGAPTVKRLRTGDIPSRISSPVSCTSCVIAPARSSSNEPAVLRRTPRPCRENNGTPSSCSSFLIWRLSAGCAKRNSCAARLTLPARATCMKFRSSRNSMSPSPHLCHRLISYDFKSGRQIGRARFHSDNSRETADGSKSNPQPGRRGTTTAPLPSSSKGWS